MIRRPLAGLLLAAALLVAACSDDDDPTEDAAPTDGTGTETTATTAPLVFEGDPDSEFCERSRAAADQPVLDPFEAGLDSREVELRFRALAQRFGGFAEIAPEPLADDLALLDDSFDELAIALEEADYDFEQLAAGGVDVSVFDDPALAVVADRLAAYQDQVCSG